MNTYRQICALIFLAIKVFYLIGASKRMSVNSYVCFIINNNSVCSLLGPCKEREHK